MPVLFSPVHTTARSEPASSMTARMSSMVVSSDWTSRTRSDSPVPRRSSMSTRPLAASPSTCRTSIGCSQVDSRSPDMWRAKIRSVPPVPPVPPVPTTWYAIATSPLRA